VNERLKALERIHSSGIKTYAFIGPLLPGNPEKLVADLYGLVNKVFIDRMNYLSSIKGFYRKAGLEFAMEDEFFLEYKARLTSELKKRKMEFEVVF
jgi:DNA repair photolyase